MRQGTERKLELEEPTGCVRMRKKCQREQGGVSYWGLLWKERKVSGTSRKKV